MENEVLQEHQNDVPETDESREGVAPSSVSSSPSSEQNEGLASPDMGEPQKHRRKSREERKAALNEKKEQILAQLRKLNALDAKEERKKRNHRLIQLGAEVEKVVGQPLEGDMLRYFIAYLQGQKDGDWIRRGMEKAGMPKAE